MSSDLIILAQQTAKSSPFGGLMNMFPFIILIFLVVYMFRAQGKEKKRREEMLNTIKSGDKVITAGGIYGEITSVSDKAFTIKVADNVKIEVAKNGVNSVVKNEE